MDIKTKIKMAEVYAGITESDVARKLEKSPQSFGQRLKTGKFTISELETIADALGAKFECSFTFPDGHSI